MHTNGPSTYEQSLVFDSGLLSSVRSILKKNNFYNFDGLLRALLYTDLVSCVTYKQWLWRNVSFMLYPFTFLKYVLLDL